MPAPALLGKRDYGWLACAAASPTRLPYVRTLPAVFAGARRVLADDGTCWLNIGGSCSVGG